MHPLEHRLSSFQPSVNEIRELEPWFHNLRINGIETAPHHFLGDYPQVKFDRFRDAIPMDMSGKSVLDIGCNAGFYSLEDHEVVRDVSVLWREDPG